VPKVTVGTGQPTDETTPSGGDDGAMTNQQPLLATGGSPLTVGAVMTPFPVVVSVDTPLDEVAERLAQNDITGAPVVDVDGRLVGVISQTDLVRMAALMALEGRSWNRYTARHVMSQEPVTARPDTPLVEAVRRLERHGVHRIVVVGDDGTSPVGIVSTSDLLPLLVDASDL
jgi:CBS domain-containing protein